VRRGSRVAAVAAAAVVLFASAAIGLPASGSIPALEKEWRWVANDRFEILTNGPERRARDILEQLEAFRAALAQLTGGQIAESPSPTRVVLFDRVWDMAPYQMRGADGEPAKFAGYFIRRGDTNYIMLSNEWGDEVPRIVFHEFAHFLVSHHLGRVPTWLNEGLAEYFSGFRYVERARRVEIGRPIVEHMRFLNSAPHLPLSQLLTISYDSPEFGHEVTRQLLYSKSWLLVHYLQVGSPERAGALARFAQAHAAGLAPVEALERAAGCSLSQLDDELAAYRRKSLVRYGAFELARDGRWTESRRNPASREDAAFRLGELLLALDPGRESEAAAHFAASGRPAPSARPTYAAYVPEAAAAVDLTPPSLDELRQSMASQPTSAAALSDFAVNVYRQQILKSPPDPVLLAEARAALLRAAELDPDDPGHAGDLLLLHRIDPSLDGVEASLRTLDAALAAHPHQHDLRIGFADLLVRAGELERAQAVAQQGLDNVGNNFAALEYARILGQLDADRAIELAKEGHLEAAVALLSARIEATPPGSLRYSLEGILASIRTTGRHNQARAVYQKAVDLTKRGEYEEAVRVLRDLLASQPPAAVEEVARKALAQLEPIVEAMRRRRGSPSGGS
jgi:tetratricopeptide (TPR) repeat protein